MGKRRIRQEESLPTFCQDTTACYTPARDGPLVEYLQRRDGLSSFPLFRGIEHFNMLRDQGWLAPRMSIIRLMWNAGRGDEHFEVTEDFFLEGIPNDAHGGRPGIHSPEKVLDGAPPFEAQNLWGPAWRGHMEALETEDRERMRKLGIIE